MNKNKSERKENNLIITEKQTRLFFLELLFIPPVSKLFSDMLGLVRTKLKMGNVKIVTIVTIFFSFWLILYLNLHPRIQAASTTLTAMNQISVSVTLLAFLDNKIRLL